MIVETPTKTLETQEAFAEWVTSVLVENGELPDTMYTTLEYLVTKRLQIRTRIFQIDAGFIRLATISDYEQRDYKNQVMILDAKLRKEYGEE